MSWSRFLIFIALLVSLASVQYALWQGGQRESAQLQRMFTEQQRKNQGLVERNQALAREIELLRTNPGAQESRARMELGLIKPGEKLVLIQSN